MMHSNEPKMVGSRASTTASSGELSASSKASSNAAVATANLKGSMDALRLDENSQGALGYEGVFALVAPGRAASGYNHRQQKECEAVSRDADAFANGAAASAEMNLLLRA